MALSHDVSHESSTTTTESHDADALADSWPQSESSKDMSVAVLEIINIDQSQLQHDDDHVITTTTTSSFEELLERNLEGFGLVMFFQVILIGLAGFFDSQQAFISIYADAIPTWHCTNNGSTTCNSKHSDICKLHASEWAWDEIPSKTIISEWGLQCSTALLRGLPASSHFAGTILGMFVLASIADSWLGRKKMLLYSCLTMSVTGIMTILSNNIWIYSSLRFVTGFCRATIGSSVIILLSEVVGKQWRGRVGNLLFFFFMVGMLFLPTIAYMNRRASWRHIYIYVYAPPLVYCLVLYLFATESPRWLFVQGRVEEAIEVIKKISPIKDNKKIHMNLNSLNEYKRHETSRSVNIFWAIKIIFSKKWSRRRMLTLMVVSFGIGLVFYGVTLGIGNLDFNIYLSGIFNGLLDIPVVFLSYFLIEKCTRKTSLLILCLAGGMFSIMIAVVGQKLKMMQITLSLASFLCADTAFNLILVFSVELFPTCVRNFAASMARQAITFGAVLGALLNSFGGRIHIYHMACLDLLLFLVDFSYLSCQRLEAYHYVIQWINKREKRILFTVKNVKCVISLIYFVTWTI
ncbi:hypothetical protein Dsin_004242 [Dipteronia sinensis]|uniref:Major facilitator superfamily (MFS) profile domain-containing protein n=1 Tax=Dipteronia sinensis TaxID=43782 RepID=A0AAE0B937_9ROSI|nr:hypothetical protein Dsin_004242 [Dipteronia sinensis]